MNRPGLIISIFLFTFACKSHAISHIPVKAKYGMVVSEQKLASKIGADILRAGGNAIDAAVAVGYALAVVHPCCGNIGGGGFMTIHLANGKDIFINFRERAPLAAKQDMYLDKEGNVIRNAATKGYLAVAVPGTVLGLETVLNQYGTLKRQEVMAPAIRLAEQGYPITSFEESWLSLFTKDFQRQPNVAAIFLKDGKPLKTGDRLVQKDLAHTLSLISENGANAFYRGPIARAIVEASKENGGILTLQDFAQYTVEELSPVKCHYRSYEIISSPPPSSGGVTLCEMLNILENFPLHDLGRNSAQSIFNIVESMRYGYIDRNRKLGDPNFINNPVQQLISKDYAAQLAKKINDTHFVLPGNLRMNYHDRFETTHYSVVDKLGNAVAVTYTLNGFYGARVIADHTGFFLNDEMDDFSVKPGSVNMFSLVQSEANSIQPGKRPLSSMTPTIVMKDGKLVMVLGSPGGPRIITSVLLTLLNVLDYGMNIQQAVNAPRFHYQDTPDTIYVEPFAISFITSKILEYKGYLITPQATWSAVEAIYVDPDDGSLQGANDFRRPDGGAIGH